MHKKSFSRAAVSLFAAMLLAAPSVYADQSAIGFDNLTAAKAVADFFAGKIASGAMVTAALSRAKKLVELSAFITLDENGALAAAKQADAARKSGAGCRPLEGVPIVVKHNIEVTGLPNTAGTKALLKYVPNKDAAVVAKLRAAGAIITLPDQLISK